MQRSQRASINAHAARPADLAAASARLREIARLDPDRACEALESSRDGLTQAQAKTRLDAYGPNVVARNRPPGIGAELWARARDPLNGLLLVLASAAWILSDVRSAAVIAAMVALSIGLGFVQEHRASSAAAKLAAMVRIQASVKRRDSASADADGFIAAPIEEILPGDIVRLSAGDMIPADLRLLEANDLFVTQAALTGESMPQEKAAHAADTAGEDLLDSKVLCFMGSSVASGYATGLVVNTGQATRFGQLATDIATAGVVTSFERGLRRFAGLMIRFIAVMAPLVFVINGVTKHDWVQALFFAVAVAVGLAPEMLPMIVTMNLSQGAVAMARKRAIVKRLNAIQNLGAMDVLCTDKTGTLTQDKVVLKLHLDVAGAADDEVLTYAYLNSRRQSGLKNLLDLAIQEHVELEDRLSIDAGYAKIDEIPFDFARRRLSVALRTPAGANLLICKGAVEEVMAICVTCRAGKEIAPLDAARIAAINALTARLNGDGFRVVAVATKDLGAQTAKIGVTDEVGLTLQGFVAFLDPPKETAAGALAALAAAGVRVKVLTGDNEIVTRKTCKDVGLAIEGVVSGRELDAMSDQDIAIAAEGANVFVKVTPSQKARIIAAIQSHPHVVGFLGDGINDAPALKRADVGISVDDAVAIAKESADIILLEKSLSILIEGVSEGRRVFANIIKYVQMSASSNFGNMLSVVGASCFLPFLPMAPLQVITNNLLYDLSQTTIPTDRVDAEALAQPHTWDIARTMRFMLCVGPISSIFDVATFVLMLVVFDAGSSPALFQTGWFVESVLTQTLVIHVLRTSKRPFVDSWASGPVILSSLAACGIAIALPYSPAAPALGFLPLPTLYWPIIAGFMAGYTVLATLAKTWFIRRWGT
ncbi:MAG: magnesium-translocating P-type ATPase [Alphaproteobacteria bacterium]|nr:magnesium-translocating P-type ATPase [Alphaproteobacteria bacterium]